MLESQARAIFDALDSRHRRNPPKHNGHKQRIGFCVRKGRLATQQGICTAWKQAQPLACEDLSATASQKAEAESYWSAAEQEQRPLCFWQSNFQRKLRRLSFVEGAKTKDELLFIRELNGICNEKNLITTTEDGTYGLQCMVTEPLSSLLDREKFDMIYTCGPEVMVKKIFELTEKRKLPIEASLERLMRCGIGLCGSCVIGKYRVCRDGPVFNAAQLREVKDELGISKIGFDGSRIPF